MTGISIQGRSSTTAFVQEVLTDIHKRNVGAGWGEAQVTPTIKLKELPLMVKTSMKIIRSYITSDDFVDPILRKIIFEKLSRGRRSEQAYQIGLNIAILFGGWCNGKLLSQLHRCPPLARTRNFYTDTDGIF